MKELKNFTIIIPCIKFKDVEKSIHNNDRQSVNSLKEFRIRLLGPCITSALLKGSICS